LHNLAKKESARASALERGVSARLAAEKTASRGKGDRAAIPADVLERLGALGYVSPGGASNSKDRDADPKDKLQEYQTASNQMMQGLIALRQNKAAAALPPLRDLAARGFDGFELQYYLGRAYAALGRHREAALEFDKTVTQQVGYRDAWRALGESRVELRDSKGAVTAFERLAVLAPDYALAHMELGEVYRDMNRMPEAATAMRRAVDLDPRPAAYWNGLGTALAASGRMPKAERAFSAAVAREGTNGLFVYNHALALEQLGQQIGGGRGVSSRRDPGLRSGPHQADATRTVAEMMVPHA
jgi:tetratricopeptide (TPR) repeat protein